MQTERAAAAGGGVSSPAVRAIPSVLLLAGVFGISAAVYPLYFQSQNQYFFHGMLRAGVGLLGQDWLAHTAEPWPLFSLLVTLTQRLLHPAAFYLYYALLFGLYAYALVGIVAWLSGARSWRTKTIPFVALLAALPSSGVGALSQSIIGFNLGGQLMSGVALQTLLGPGLQPATFGALLVLSILVFLRGSAMAAAVLAALAAVIHPIYLLPAGLLIIVYAGLTLSRGEGVPRAVSVAAVGLLLMAPLMIYVFDVFRPSSPEAWATSRTILVNFRFPHHAIAARWFGPMVLLKMGVVLAALVLVRRTALFWILAGLFATGAGLTLLQVTSGNPALAVLFPWRVSVLLVPVSTAIVLGPLVGRVVDGVERRLPRGHLVVMVLSLLLLLVSLGLGAAETLRRFAAEGRGDEARLIDFVRRTRVSGETYLIPRWWEEFRLSTGAPVFVDFHFIPYEDRAVLEWYRRVRLIDALQAAPAVSRCGLLDGIASAYPVTHVVLERAELNGCPGWREVFSAGRLRLYGRS